MQELEKILEEMKESSIMVATSKEHYIHPQDGRFVEEVVLLNDVEEIIRKHMSGKGKDAHMNDGWISAKKKPEEDGFYVATMSGILANQKEPFVGLAEFEDGEWVDGNDVIVWRPLPEPYHPERSKRK